MTDERTCLTCGGVLSFVAVEANGDTSWHCTDCDDEWFEATLDEDDDGTVTVPRQDVMRQEAPWPTDLQELVASCKFRSGVTVTLEDIDRGQGSKGLTLVVHITTDDAYRRERRRSVVHYFPVIPAAYDRRSWRRWLFEQLHAVDLHEAMEFFETDGVKPYAPSHGPGNDPYMLREVGTDLDRRTSFRGEVSDD